MNRTSLYLIRRRCPLAASLILFFAAGCIAPTDQPTENKALSVGALPTWQQQRMELISQVALEHIGIQVPPWMLAGIALAETNLAHCYHEANPAMGRCEGPVHPDCDTGEAGVNSAVLAGAADGPCTERKGGLGMFQFDAGLFADTKKKYGNGVLSLSGNIEEAIKYVTQMVRNSGHAPYSLEGAETWMCGVQPDSAAWKAWVQTVTHDYNGCAPGNGCYAQRYNHYDRHAQTAYHALRGGLSGASRIAPLGISWSVGLVTDTNSNGGVRVLRDQHHLRAFLTETGGKRSIHEVRFYIDRTTELGSAKWDGNAERERGGAWVLKYPFNLPQAARPIEARGYDKEGNLVALGRGLIDTDYPGVYIWPTGRHTYEIGYDRGGMGPTAIRVDELRWEQGTKRSFWHPIVDGLSGQERSTRLAVRATFTPQCAPRTFRIRLFEQGKQDDEAALEYKRRFTIR